MRHPATVLLCTLLCAAAGRAESGVTCEPGPLGSLREDSGKLRVVEAPAGTLEAGDVVLQLNGRVLATCTDLAKAVADARAGGVKALLLVKRGDSAVPVVLDLSANRTTPEPTAPRPPATVARPPQPPATMAIPRDIDPSSTAGVLSALDDMKRIGRGLAERFPVPATASIVRRLQNLTEDCRARLGANPAAGLVGPILDYYDTAAEILAYEGQASARHQRPARQLRRVFEYQSNSDVAAWLRRYPFLEPSIREAPERLKFLTTGEKAGYWAPDDAVELLIRRALSDGDALAAKLR